MKLSNEQLRQIADAAKIVAIGQFGYVAWQSNSFFWLLLSAGLFIHIVLFGVLILGFIEENK